MVFTLTALPACLYIAPSATFAAPALSAKSYGNPCSINASFGVNFRMGILASSSLLILSDGLSVPFERMYMSLK